MDDSTTRRGTPRIRRAKLSPRERYPEPGKKRCSSCWQVFAPTYFQLDSTSTDGRKHWCPDCTRAYHTARHAAGLNGSHRPRYLKSKYGITEQQYTEMLDAQDHRCAICFSDTPGKDWHIDHDHVTGDVRGILCFACNTALGLMQDNSDILLSAVDYLRR
jgi:hypothetical protein